MLFYLFSNFKRSGTTGPAIYVACSPSYLLAVLFNYAKFLHTDWNYVYISVLVTWSVHCGYSFTIDIGRLLPRGCYGVVIVEKQGSILVCAAKLPVEHIRYF